MSQKAFFAKFDALAHGRFKKEGAADTGQYFANDADTVGQPVEVFVNRDKQLMGTGEQMLAGHIEVAYVLKPGLGIRKGGRLVVDGDTFVNAKPMHDDGSLSRWQVRRG